MLKSSCWRTSASDCCTQNRVEESNLLQFGNGSQLRTGSELLRAAAAIAVWPAQRFYCRHFIELNSSNCTSRSGGSGDCLCRRRRHFTQQVSIYRCASDKNLQAAAAFYLLWPQQLAPLYTRRLRATEGLRQAASLPEIHLPIRLLLLLLQLIFVYLAQASACQRNENTQQLETSQHNFSTYFPAAPCVCVAKRLFAAFVAVPPPPVVGLPEKN